MIYQCSATMYKSIEREITNKDLEVTKEKRITKEEFMIKYFEGMLNLDSSSIKEIRIK